MRNGQIVIIGDNQMLVGITHGKVNKQVVSAINEKDTQTLGVEKIIIKFIEGSMKNEQL